MGLVDRLGQLVPAGPEHRGRASVAEHLGEGSAPRAGAHDSRSHVDEASGSESVWTCVMALFCISLAACLAFLRSIAGWYGVAGGVSPRMPASRPVMSFMIFSVASRSTGEDSGLPANSDRSTGGPATICTVLRGNRCGRTLP